MIAISIANQIGNAVDQHRGLAAACARQNQQRAIDLKHCLLLTRIHAGEFFFHCFLFQVLCRVLQNRHPPNLGNLRGRSGRRP